MGRAIIGSYARLMFKLDVVRQAPLPAGPKVFAANHPSTLDPVWVMMLADEQTSALILETLFKVPVLGTYLRRAGHVPVVEGAGGAALDEGIRLLKAGRTLVMFPEGVISPLEGGFHRPRTGVARQALSAGVPVIPVGISLQRERIRLRETMVAGKKEVGTWYLRGRYAMTVGRPLHFDGDVEDREYVRSVSGHIMESIITLTHCSAQRLREALHLASGAMQRPAQLADIR